MIDKIVEMSISTWSPGIYEESLSLLRRMEDRLAKADAHPWIPGTINRFVMVPLFLFMRGAEQMFASFGRAYGYVSFIVLVGFFVSGSLPEGIRHTVQIITTVLSVAVVLMYMFAAPSTYCSAGVNPKHVRTVRDQLNQLRIENAARLELIIRNLKVFEERIKRRLGMYGWVLSAGWAIYYAPLIARTIGIGTVTPQSDGSIILPALGLLILTFFTVQAYSRGVDILFRSLELGCNEQLANFQKLKT